MSATYDSTLPDDRNFIRFLINDTATSTAVFQDEEIDAVLVEEAITVTVAAALKYFGAARLLDRLHAQLGTGGTKHGGAMSKRVDDLARSFGISASTSAALDEKARELRRRGARLLNTRRSHFFRAMGGAVIVLCVSASSLAAQTIYSWLPFLPPVANAAALPTCANNTLTEWRMITALSPAPGSLYICPDGGGSWSCLVGADCPSTGSVTSVAITMPAEFSVSGSPIVGAGTLAITEATQSANRLYAGPSSGAAAAPGFRAIVGADLGSGTPSSANYLRGDMSWVAISSDPTLAGDVDGLSSANDLDETAVEAELEAVLDLQDIQGATTDNQVPNNITVDLATSATSAADVSCTNCLGGTEIDESSLTLSGVGDVVGPASVTDNSIALFSGTTGKLLRETSPTSYAYATAMVVRAAGLQLKNGSLYVGHQAFGDYDNPVAVMSGNSVPDVRAGSGSAIGGALKLYLGCILFTSSANAENAHNSMICNEYDGEIGIGSPDAAFDPRAFSTGGLKTGVVTKTADYTLTANDYTLVCDATAGNVTFTLPTIAAQTRRRIYRLKKIDSSGNSCSFARSSTDTIDGATSAATSTQYASIEVQSPDTGADWMKF